VGKGYRWDEGAKWSATGGRSELASLLARRRASTFAPEPEGY